MDFLNHFLHHLIDINQREFLLLILIDIIIVAIRDWAKVNQRYM